MARTRQTPRTWGYEGDSLEFETLIADISSGLIDLPPDEVDGAVKDALLVDAS